MGERPTPEEIIGGVIESRFDEGWMGVNDCVLEALAEHGYVIVHPDDVRPRDERIIRATCEFVKDSREYPVVAEEFDEIIAVAEAEGGAG